jgi:hypothetical protein
MASPSSKRVVHQLQERIKNLEECLKAVSGITKEDPLDNIPGSTSDAQQEEKSTKDLFEQTDNFAPLEPPQYTPNTSAPQNPPSNESGSEFILEESPRARSLSDYPRPTSDSDEEYVQSEHGDLYNNKSARRKSCFRMSADGHIHYFGSTADYQPALVSPSQPSDSDVNVLSDFSNLQNSLLDLFWQHPHPFLRLFDREAFMSGIRRGKRTQYYSPFLLTCILLRSIHLSDAPLAKTLEPSLFEKAKEQLFMELERPDHTTALALQFLSTYVSGVQSRSCLGWLYIGMLGIYLRVTFDTNIVFRNCWETAF